MKTFSLKPSAVSRVWYVINASEATLGRLSSEVAKLLIGKSKPNYTPHVDSGDYVIIVNAAELRVTGQKIDKKVYYRHSSYPGSLKKTTLEEKLAQDPTQVIFKSVRGMLPVNKLRDGRLKRLKIYPDAEHQHEAQKPRQISIRSKLHG